jgi:hypothetical protein
MILIVVVGVILAWMLLSACMITVACMYSSQLSQAEELPRKLRSKRFHPRGEVLEPKTPAVAGRSSASSPKPLSESKSL